MYVCMYAKPVGITKNVCYRQFKSIDSQDLRQDLKVSDLCTKEYTDLEQLSCVYNSTLTSLLDKYAPEKKNVVVCRQRLPWLIVRLGVP